MLFNASKFMALVIPYNLAIFKVGDQPTRSACRALDAELAFQLLGRCRAGERPSGSRLIGGRRYPQHGRRRA